MKKILCGLLSALTLFLFAGCGSKKPMTVEDIPATGAETYITSVNSLADMLEETADEFDDDYWVKRFSSQEFQETLHNLIMQASTATAIMETQQDIQKFANDIQTKGYGKYVHKNRSDLSILKPFADYGFSFEGTRKPYEITVKKSGDNVNYDVKIIFPENFTTITFDGTVPEGEYSVFKSAKMKGSFSGVITAKINIIALNSLTMGQYTSGFLNSLSDIKVKYNFNFGLGGGFCNSKKSGGKFFISLASQTDTTLQPAFFEKFDEIGDNISNLFDGEPYNADNINSIPAEISVNMGFFDDKNNPTFTIINAETFEGLFTDILDFAHQIETRD